MYLDIKPFYNRCLVCEGLYMDTVKRSYCWDCYNDLDIEYMNREPIIISKTTPKKYDEDNINILDQLFLNIE